MYLCVYFSVRCGIQDFNALRSEYLCVCLSLCVRARIFTHIECIRLHASTHVP